MAQKYQKTVGHTERMYFSSSESQFLIPRSWWPSPEKVVDIWGQVILENPVVTGLLSCTRALSTPPRRCVFILYLILWSLFKSHWYFLYTWYPWLLVVFTPFQIGEDGTITNWLVSQVIADAPSLRHFPNLPQSFHRLYFWGPERRVW